MNTHQRQMVWLCKKICFLLIMACWPQGPRGWSHSSVVKYFTSFFSWEFISWVILTLMWWTKQPTCPWNPLDQLLKNWLLFQLIYRQLIVINMTKHQEIWPHANKGRLGVNHRDLISFLLVRLKGYASFITLLLIQGARGPNQACPLSPDRMTVAHFWGGSHYKFCLAQVTEREREYDG